VRLADHRSLDVPEVPDGQRDDPHEEEQPDDAVLGRFSGMSAMAESGPVWPRGLVWPVHPARVRDGSAVTASTRRREGFMGSSRSWPRWPVKSHCAAFARSSQCRAAINALARAVEADWESSPFIWMMVEPDTA
jgi:hypothetical protein